MGYIAVMEKKSEATIQKVKGFASKEVRASGFRRTVYGLPKTWLGLNEKNIAEQDSQKW